MARAIGGDAANTPCASAYAQSAYGLFFLMTCHKGIIMRTILIFILILSAFTCVSCKKPVTEQTVNEVLEPQTAQPAEEAPMDNFNFAETITATKEDIIKALQGEWSSKENGFNYSLKFENNWMMIWYSDHEQTRMEYDVKPGMPVEIVPELPVFDQAKGRGYSEIYRILSMYYVNDRITLNVRPKDRDHELEDEVVLSRGLTDEALLEAEGVKPKPNLVYNSDSPHTAKTILQAIQGTWEGRDNCNYKVMITDKEIKIYSHVAEILSTKLHLSQNNPAHIELDSYDLDSGNIPNDIFGLYYLDDSAILLSIHSGFRDNKFEYILRKPEYFGRFIMDKEIIPELEGEWKDQRGNTLTIHGNDIEYDGQKDTFHVVTRSFEEKNERTFHLVSQSNERYIFGGLFMPFEYSGGRLSTRMEIMDAPSPEFIFTRVK